jgi:hypothetical protein
MGEVYKDCDPRVKRNVALKVLAEEPKICLRSIEERL